MSLKVKRVVSFRSRFCAGGGVTIVVLLDEVMRIMGVNFQVKNSMLVKEYFKYRLWIVEQC